LAWKANEPEVLGVCVNVVPSTAPLASVSAPEVCAGEPAHVPLVNQLKVTVPVGVPTAPLTVALSWMVVPAATEVTTLCDASWISVATAASILATLSTSQAPSFCAKFVASTMPLTNARALDVCDGEPVQVALVNQLKVTVPVGVPTVPL